MRARRLRHAVVWFRLHGVDQVRELDRILDKEHRNVVAHQVVVTFRRVELDSKSADIAYRVR